MELSELKKVDAYICTNRSSLKKGDIAFRHEVFNSIGEANRSRLYWKENGIKGDIIVPCVLSYRIPKKKS